MSLVKKDGAETRRERIKQFAMYVHAQLHENNGTPIFLSKTVASLAVETGLSKPKITEYLDLLDETGQFKIDRQNDQIKKCAP